MGKLIPSLPCEDVVFYFMTVMVLIDSLSPSPWTDKSFLRREIIHSWLDGSQQQSLSAFPLSVDF